MSVEAGQATGRAEHGVQALEHVDVLILGAGLSGIGAACHLRTLCPRKSFAILEARSSIGGTWDLFRYPGIRSDSDMFTLGYSFRPWEGSKALADGGSILDYVRDTAREHAIDEHIRFGHRATRAEWSSADARWTVHALRADTGETVSVTCDFLYACTGYYRYDEGYTPEFAGRERFAGRFLHAQHWPADLDCAGKRVVVIGSGATAVTLVPALAEQGARVTMLQRSPSYVLSLPAHDVIADKLRERLPPKLAYSIVRWKNVLLAMLNFQLSRRAPRAMRKLIRRLAQSQLPDGFDVDTHFNPTYDPWDQRLCLVPDGDLFKALGSGRTEIVTGRIATFTERGVELDSGEQLDADVIVAATGLNLLVLGGLELAVDGRAIDVGESVAYKGMMLCGVPNMALTLGYTNASWTLKADLVAQYVCRTLNHMDATGAAICTPREPDASLPTEPIIDLKSGYVLRSLHALPRQGTSAPWRLHQNYVKDVRLLKRGPLDDAIAFSPRGQSESPASGPRESLPPGPRAPIAVQTLAMRTRQRPYLERARRRYGPLFTVRLIGLGDTVIVADPDLIKQTFRAEPSVLHAGTGSPLRELLGEHSLLGIDEREHLEQRKLLLPPFKGQRMKQYESTIAEIAAAEIDGWSHGVEFETVKSMQRITLRAILRAVFGADGERLHELEELIPRWTALGARVSLAPELRLKLGRFSPWARFLALRAQLDAILDELIVAAKADPQLTERADVLALIVQARHEDGSPMDNAEIRDELVTMLVAGHETTANTLAWAVERIRRHPELLPRLAAEADEGGSALREATIREVQRTRPVIAFAGRFVRKPFELGGHRLPVGSRILLAACLTHYDPELFPHPERFEPERFLDKLPDTYSWIPFGGGIRRCIGATFAHMEMDVVLRVLLERVELVPTDAPGERWAAHGIVWSPGDGGKAIVRARVRSPHEQLVAA